ncbi:MAG: hypothetical protein RL281_1335, partial [Pseudomonadota bacterium]
GKAIGVNRLGHVFPGGLKLCGI